MDGRVDTHALGTTTMTFSSPSISVTGSHCGRTQRESVSAYPNSIHDGHAQRDDGCDAHMVEDEKHKQTQTHSRSKNRIQLEIIHHRRSDPAPRCEVSRGAVLRCQREEYHDCNKAVPIHANHIHTQRQNETKKERKRKREREFDTTNDKTQRRLNEGIFFPQFSAVHSYPAHTFLTL